MRRSIARGLAIRIDVSWRSSAAPIDAGVVGCTRSPTQVQTLEGAGSAIGL